MSEPTRKLDRRIVRALVEKHSDERRQVLAAGGNVYQKTLDQQDRIDEFAASMTTDEAVAFYSMIEQETTALTLRLKDLTAKINLETEIKNRQTQAIIDAQDNAAPSILSTLAYGLVVLSLLPVALARIGGEGLLIFVVLAILAFLILFVKDLLKWIAARTAQTIRTRRAEQVRFSPEWKKAQAARRRL